MNILSDKIMKIRKKHQCWACLRSFDAGSKMARQVQADLGGIGNCYTCVTCDELLKLQPRYKSGMLIFSSDEDESFPGEVIEECREFDVDTPEQLLELIKDKGYYRR